MEQRQKERTVPKHVIRKAAKRVKERITNQAKWRLKNGGFDFEHTPCDRILRELDCGGSDNVLRDYCTVGLYSYEGQGVFKELGREV
jgi:hypothetical protein